MKTKLPPTTTTLKGIQSRRPIKKGRMADYGDDLLDLCNSAVAVIVYDDSGEVDSVTQEVD